MGTGTVLDPFLVATAADLAKVGTGTDGWDLDKHYLQIADIDLAAYTDDGGWQPIGADSFFAGSYDGDGHTIENLTIDRPGSDGQGLFGIASGANLQNIKLVDVSVNGKDGVGGLVGGASFSTISNSHVAGTVAGNGRVGGLAGMNDGPVDNCHFSGDVVGSGSYIGGLVGYNMSIIEPASIESCYSEGSVVGNSDVGGLVGHSIGCEIVNCYSTSDVECSSIIAGGLVGNNAGENALISNSYSTGLVTSDDPTGNSGGLVGSSTGIVTACFWDTETSGWQTSAGGTGKTTAQMQAIATYNNWDILKKADYEAEGPSAWYVDEGTDYPRLSWEYFADIYVIGEAMLTAGGAITAEGLKEVIIKPFYFFGTGNLGTLPAATSAIVDAWVEINSVGDLAAAGEVIKEIETPAALDGSGVLTGTGGRIVSVAPELISGGALLGAGDVLLDAGGNFDAVGDLLGAGDTLMDGDGALGGTGALTGGIGEIIVSGAALYTGSADIGATVIRIVYGGAELSSVCSLSAAGQRIVFAGSEITAVGNLQAVGETIVEALAGDLAGSGLLESAGGVMEKNLISFELVFGPTTLGLNPRKKRVRRLYLVVSKADDARLYVAYATTRDGPYSNEVSIGRGRALTRAKKMLPLAVGDPAGSYIYRVRVRGWGEAAVHEIAFMVSPRR